MKKIYWALLLFFSMVSGSQAGSSSRCVVSIGACEAGGLEALKRVEVTTYHYNGRRDFYLAYTYESRLSFRLKYRWTCLPDEKFCQPTESEEFQISPFISPPFRDANRAESYSRAQCDEHIRLLEQSYPRCTD